MIENIKAKTFYSYLCGFFALSLATIYTGSSLLYDSSNYIVRLAFFRLPLATGDFRDLAFFFNHMPSLLYTRYISRDLAALSYLFQLTHLLWPSLLLLLHYLIASESNKKMAYFHLGSLYMMALFSFYCSVSELHIAVGFTWIAISQFREVSSKRSLFFFVLFSVLSNACHSIMLLLTPLMIFEIYKTFVKKKIGAKFYSVIVVTISTVIFQLYSLYDYSKRNTESYENFFANFSNYAFLKYFFLMIFLFVLFLSINHVFKRKKVTLFILAILSYFIFFEWNLFAPWVHLAGRSFSVVAVTALMYLSLTPYNFYYSRLNKDIMRFCLIFIVFFNIYYYQFSRELVSYVNSNNGIVYRKDISFPVWKLASDHALPQLSLLLTKNKENVSTFILSDVDPFLRISGEKFVEYSKRVNVEYDPELEKEIKKRSTNIQR